jgi:hypothetical protein
MADTLQRYCIVMNGDTDKKSREGFYMTVELDNEAQTALDAPASDAVSSEDMFHKDVVSKIVDREKQKAYEKGKREAIMQLNQEQVAQQQSAQPEVGMNQQHLGQAQPPVDVERLIAEKAPEILAQQLQGHIQKMQNEQFVNSFVTKMQAAEQKYPGLEKQLAELDYDSMTPLIKLANNLDNTGDIMKELLDNPMKMGNLLALTYTQPGMAQRAMQELSGSIRQNQEALEREAQARDPMSQLKPSSSAGMDANSMSVTNFRKMFGPRGRR